MQSNNGFWIVSIQLQDSYDLDAGTPLPPKCIKFFSSDAAATSLDGASSENNCQLLSAGQDRTLRYFHTARAEQTQSSLRESRKHMQNESDRV